MPYRAPTFGQQGPSQPSFQNPFLGARAKNVLTPSFDVEPPSMGMVGQQEQQQEEDPYYSAYKSILDRPTPNLDAWKQHTQNTPQMGDYRPSGWTRAAAALSGLSAGIRNPGEGIKVAQDLNSSNYRGAMSEYAARGASMKELAALEDADKNEEVKALMAARTFGLDRDKFQSEDAYRRAQGSALTRTAGAREATASAALQNARTTALTAGGAWSNQANGGRQYSSPGGGTMFIPGQNIDAAQLPIQAANANANIMGANASLSNAATNRNDLNWRMTRPAEPPSVADTTGARTQAAQELSRNAKFRPFFKFGDDGSIQGIDESKMNHPNYRLFLEALDETSRAITDGNIFVRPPKQPALPPGAGLMMPSHRPGGGR